MALPEESLVYPLLMHTYQFFYRARYKFLAWHNMHPKLVDYVDIAQTNLNLCQNHSIHFPQLKLDEECQRFQNTYGPIIYSLNP